MKRAEKIISEVISQVNDLKAWNLISSIAVSFIRINSEVRLINTIMWDRLDRGFGWNTYGMYILSVNAASVEFMGSASKCHKLGSTAQKTTV